MKKARRIYRELGLQLRNKHPKRRMKAKLREDRQEAAGPNEVWAMDFVHDQLATGKKLRVLTIVDTHSRYCPATDPRFAYRGEDIVQTPERICKTTGYPQVSHNLAGILGLSAQKQSPAGTAGLGAVTLVAGVGFEPTTFGL